jgi:hypothetical protein
MTAVAVYNICYMDVSPLWVLSLTILSSTSDLTAPKMNRNAISNGLLSPLRSFCYDWVLQAIFLLCKSVRGIDCKKDWITPKTLPVCIQYHVFCA